MPIQPLIHAGCSSSFRLAWSGSELTHLDAVSQRKGNRLMREALMACAMGSMVLFGPWLGQTHTAFPSVAAHRPVVDTAIPGLIHSSMESENCHGRAFVALPAQAFRIACTAASTPRRLRAQARPYGAFSALLTRAYRPLTSCAGPPPQRPIPIAEGTAAVAVDERAARAFVLSSAAIGAGKLRALDACTGVLRRTSAVGTSPYALALDAAAGRVFVANQADKSLSILDGYGRPLATVRLLGTPTALALDGPTRHLFVVGDRGVGTAGVVSILDVDRGAVLRTVPVGDGPLAVAVDAATNRIFVAASDNRVSMLDAASGRVLRTVRVGAKPFGVAVNAHTRRVFVANEGDNSVSILDAATGAVLRTLPVGGSPTALASDDRTNRVFVADINSVSVLDARSGALLTTVDVGERSTPAAPVVDPGTGWVFVLTRGPLDKTGTPIGRGILFVLDGVTGAVRRRVMVGTVTFGSSLSQQVAVDGRTKRVFVLNDSSVSVLDDTHL